MERRDLAFRQRRDLAAFEADPQAFAPRYGGYCAWAVSQGSTASTDPTAWCIVDGRLYLNYSHAVQRRWAQDLPGNIAMTDTNWPGVLDWAVRRRIVLGLHRAIGAMMKPESLGPDRQRRRTP